MSNLSYQYFGGYTGFLGSFGGIVGARVAGKVGVGDKAGCIVGSGVCAGCSDGTGVSAGCKDGTGVSGSTLGPDVGAIVGVSVAPLLDGAYCRVGHYLTRSGAVCPSIEAIGSWIFFEQPWFGWIASHRLKLIDEVVKGNTESPLP